MNRRKKKKKNNKKKKKKNHIPAGDIDDLANKSPFGAVPRVGLGGIAVAENLDLARARAGGHPECRDVRELGCGLEEKSGGG
jgi:hypothetical protein